MTLPEPFEQGGEDRAGSERDDVADGDAGEVHAGIEGERIDEHAERAERDPASCRRSRRTPIDGRTAVRKSRMPPMPIVQAPIASGDTSSGKKVAAVPVVPHSSEAMTRASTPAPRPFSTAPPYRPLPSLPLLASNRVTFGYRAEHTGPEPQPYDVNSPEVPSPPCRGGRSSNSGPVPRTRRRRGCLRFVLADRHPRDRSVTAQRRVPTRDLHRQARPIARGDRRIRRSRPSCATCTTRPPGSRRWRPAARITTGRRW